MSREIESQMLLDGWHSVTVDDKELWAHPEKCVFLVPLDMAQAIEKITESKVREGK